LDKNLGKGDAAEFSFWDVFVYTNPTMPKRASSQAHSSRSKKTAKRLAVKYARKAAQK
jgi:hypothetical protein